MCVSSFPNTKKNPLSSGPYPKDKGPDMNYRLLEIKSEAKSKEKHGVWDPMPELS
jgi:hypothetical protein